MTTPESAKSELFDAIVAYNKDRVVAAVQAARSVIKAEEIIEAMAAGMNEVGIRFERGKLFLPHVMAAAGSMTAGVKLVEGDLPAKEAGDTETVVVMATVEGDVHDIGKSIVSTMLQCDGYRVVDLGRDIPIRNIIDTAVQEDAKAIGMSALMTTTMQAQRECIELLVEEGIRNKIKVLVGGALLRHGPTRLAPMDMRRMLALGSRRQMNYSLNFSGEN